MTTKTLDKKGRISLGAQYANATVIVDDSDSARIVITPAKVIPSHEAWLYQNKDALVTVLQGLAQAKKGELVDGPAINAPSPEDDEN